VNYVSNSLPLMLNLALVSDELKNALGRVLNDCNTALELKPEYLKVSCRKAQALIALERFEEANVCISEALLLHPDESTLQKLKAEVQPKLPQEESPTSELDKEALLEME